MDALIEAIIQQAQQLPPELAVVMVAMLPVLEVRGAIPLGFAMGLSPAQALLFSIIGNLIPIPFLLLMLDPIVNLFRRVPLVGKLVDVFRNRAQAQSERAVHWGWWGLALFVAVPLPTTGAWTAAAIAALIGYPFRKGLSAIICGVLAAGLLVTILSILGWNLAS